MATSLPLLAHVSQSSELDLIWRSEDARKTRHQTYLDRAALDAIEQRGVSNYHARLAAGVFSYWRAIVWC